MNYYSQKRGRKIASNLLLHRGELLHNPVVELTPDGEILSIEFVESSMLDYSPETEFYSGIMMAGFINVHSHLELAYLRGQIEPYSGFAGFASKIGQIRNNFSTKEREMAIVRANSEMRRGGVAAVGDITNGDSSFRTKERSEIEYRNFAEVFGLNTIDTKAVDNLLKYPLTSLTPH